MLFIPIVQCQCNNPESDGTKRCLQGLVMPLTIAVGFFLCCRCKTCQETNGQLYSFVKMYLIYQTTVWISMMFMVSCLVTMIFWLHRHGFLETGPGPAMAAKPGLIEEIETVAYRSELFATSGEDADDMQPPECSICQEEFNDENPIKRTPCGHFFHEECLGNWLGNFARSCPLCRTDLEEAMEHRDASELERGEVRDRGDRGVAVASGGR
mmetsp:Transcript_115440/g.246722  ORF Transcript_115440/g.246722 Transcript_115440/m.246722 type:complete len:211 (+) Transcript_115440:2-634(+)